MLIAEIDGLRGLAILFVMVHRLWPRDALWALPEAGWIGVDLFFVVSGYLITRILLATRDEPGFFRNFYARRVLRIFPLYYVFVGGVLAVGTAAMHAQAGSSAWYVMFLGNIPESLLGHDPPYWLAPVWSLAIEEQFYLTFPHLVRHLDRRRLAQVLVGLFLLAPLVRVLGVLAWPDRERFQYLFTLCRTDAIATGCLLAIVSQSKWFQRLRRPFALVAGAAIVVELATGLDRTTMFGRIAGYSFVALGFGAIVGLVLLERGRRATALLRVPSLRYIGKLCFGLYLLHRVADTLTDAGAAHFGLDATTGILWVPIKIGVAVGLASVSWFVLERRMLRLKRFFSSAAHPTARTATAAAAIALVAGCGFPHGGGFFGMNDGPGKPGDGHADAGHGSDGSADAPDGGTTTTGDAVLYTFDRRHSPITPGVVQRLMTIAAANRSTHADVFAKVGDSMTEMTDFMTCFDGGPYDLAGNTALSATLAYYLDGDAARASPFKRTSLAATGGWTAADILAGSPSPLDQELAAIAPSVAVVMVGTNDDRYGRTLSAYGNDLWTIVDRLIAAGVVPVVSAIPPMHSDPSSDARVPVFDLVVRAIAQGRQIPFVDYYREMIALPAQGIGSDGLHPSVSPDGPCDFQPGDLQYGWDVRNLVVLEQLDRTRAALAGTASDASALAREGTGTLADPVLASFPLADLGNTRSGDASFAFSACAPATGTGPQLVYEVQLAAPATIDVYAFTRTGDAPIHVLAGAPLEASCVAGGQGTVTATLPAGTSYLVVGGDGEVVVAAAAR